MRCMELSFLIIATLCASCVSKEQADSSRPPESLSRERPTLDEKALDGCVEAATLDFDRRRQDACRGVYHLAPDCDVTGRGTMGIGLYANYFRERNLCLVTNVPGRVEQNVSRRDACITRARQDLEAKRVRACVDLYHEGTDCSVLGRGTFGRELYANFDNDIAFCEKRYPLP